ncbi:drug transporter [Mycobacterium tuberculosis]|nr:drug transporter [Mycobacterium tuberculosis]
MPDVRGAVLLAFALGLLTLGLIKGPDWGWASLPTSGSLLAAAVAMVGFVMSSRHHPAPMVEPTLLRIQSFVAGTGLTAVASAGFYAYLLTHVLFLNYVWGYTLLEAGMAVAPAALVAAVVAAVLGRVADRHGYRFIVGIGALIWAASLLWYLKVVGSQPDFLGEWLPGQILQGIGVGATFPLLGSAALARLAKGGSYATASAVTGTIRQVGAVIGVAVLVILVGTPAPGAAEEALRHGWALAAICFVAVGIGALSLGRIRPVPAAVEPPPGPPVAPLGARRPPRPAPVASPAAAVAPTPKTSREVNLLEALRFARPDTQQIELQAGSYLFHAGDVSDALYVVRSGRLQVLAGDGAKDEVVAELGRGQVVGELGVLLDAPRSASVRAVRDSSLMRVTKAEFAKIADAGVLGALAGYWPNDSTRHAWPLSGQRRRSLSRSSVSTPMHRSQWWPPNCAGHCRHGYVLSPPAGSTATGWNVPSRPPTGWCCMRPSATRGGGNSVCVSPIAWCWWPATRPCLWPRCRPERPAPTWCWPDGPPAGSTDVPGSS